MRIILKNMRKSLLSTIIILFIVTNMFIIFKIEETDRTILISEPLTTQKGTLKEKLRTEGNAEPSDIYKVFYEEQKGTLSEILVEEGDEVQAGTPLLTYIIEKDSSEVISELKRANDRLNVEVDKLNDDLSILQSEIDDYKNLQTDDEEKPDLDNTRMIEYEIKNIEYEIKMIELQIEENQTTIDLAQKEENSITVESKIDGIIVQSDEFSRTLDEPILTIMNRSPMLVHALVSEDQVQRIKVDQNVLIEPKHLETKMLKGKVMKISDVPYGEEAKEDKSLYRITIQLEDEKNISNEKTESQLLIGSHVTADIIVSELKNVVVLPEDSLEGKRVVALEKGKLVQKKVTIGLRANDKVAVTSGLKEGQWILPKGDSTIKVDTRYIQGVDFNQVSKDSYEGFTMEEKIWLLARGIIQ